MLSVTQSQNKNVLIQEHNKDDSLVKKSTTAIVSAVGKEVIEKKTSTFTLESRVVKPNFWKTLQEQRKAAALAREERKKNRWAEKALEGHRSLKEGTSLEKKEAKAPPCLISKTKGPEKRYIEIVTLDGERKLWQGEKLETSLAPEYVEKTLLFSQKNVRCCTQDNITLNTLKSALLLNGYDKRAKPISVVAFENIIANNQYQHVTIDNRRVAVIKTIVQSESDFRQLNEIPVVYFDGNRPLEKDNASITRFDPDSCRKIDTLRRHISPSISPNAPFNWMEGALLRINKELPVLKFSKDTLSQGYKEIPEVLPYTDKGRLDLHYKHVSSFYKGIEKAKRKAP